MKVHVSILRHLIDNLLNLVGAGPRSSRFTAARNPESRARFATYVSRLQPAVETVSARRTSRLLGTGGAVSKGFVRHAPESINSIPSRRPMFRMLTQPGEIAALRRARAERNAAASPLQSIFHALRVR